MSTSDPDGVRRLLYAGPRATFLERRKEAAAAARADGDRETATVIAALRKPSAAAHLVNLLAQADDEALDELIDLGAKIREAFEQGDDAEMRELLQRRAGAIADTVAHARAIARSTGDSMSAAVTDQVTQTLRAAMASATAAEEVRGGTLIDSLDDPGFTSLGVAPPPRRPTPKPSAGRRKKSAPSNETEIDGEIDTDGEADRRRAEAAAELRRVEAAAAAALKTAERTLAAAAEHRGDLEERRDELVSHLAAIEAELAAARVAEEDAEVAQQQAGAALDDARTALEE